jgi:hypothetical protein
MRIVYNTLSGAVLAAGQWSSGDVIVEPSALQIFPEFNGTYHSSFTVDAGLPADLIPNYLNYSVDNPITPTTVVAKNHIQLIPTSTTMTADGKETNAITANILNASDVGVNGTFNLAIVTKSVFAQQNTLATTGTPSTGVFTVVSGLVTDAATVQAIDTNVDPVVGVPGLLPSNLVQIQLSPSSAAQSPLASVSPSSKAVRSGSWAFNGNGAVYASNMSEPNQEGANSPANEPEGMMTEYEAVGFTTGGAIFGGMTIYANQLVDMYFRFKTMTIAVQRWWLGLFSVDPSGTNTPTSAVGFRFMGGTDTGWVAYYNDGTTTTAIPTGVAVANDTLYEMEVSYNPGLNGGTLAWIIGGVQVATLSGLAAGTLFTPGTGLGLCAEVNNTGGNINVGIKLSATELQYT